MDDCIPRRECDACKELYDTKIDAIDNRLKEVETSVKQIHELTISVKEMAVSLNQMAKQLERQSAELAEIKEEPAKKWKQTVWLIIAGFVGAGITFFLSKIGL